MANWGICGVLGGVDHVTSLDGCTAAELDDGGDDDGGYATDGML